MSIPQFSAAHLNQSSNQFAATRFASGGNQFQPTNPLSDVVTPISLDQAIFSGMSHNNSLTMGDRQALSNAFGWTG